MEDRDIRLRVRPLRSGTSTESEPAAVAGLLRINAATKTAGLPIHCVLVQIVGVHATPHQWHKTGIGA